MSRIHVLLTSRVKLWEEWRLAFVVLGMQVIFAARVQMGMTDSQTVCQSWRLEADDPKDVEHHCCLPASTVWGCWGLIMGLVWRACTSKTNTLCLGRLI